MTHAPPSNTSENTRGSMMSSASISDSSTWRLVPAEPTEAMKRAGNEALGPWIAPAMNSDSAYHAMLAAAPTSPALHAPTVEALKHVAMLVNSIAIQQTCQELAASGLIDDIADADFKGAHDNIIETARDARAALRALTSGAEAGKRTDGVHQVPWKNIVIEPDQEASAEPRPLSEWSDEELFRALGADNASICAFASNLYGYELHRRGWLPHHGGDKAPVKGAVEVWFRAGNGGILKDAVKHRWAHMGTYADIIAYRPVPAKAEPIRPNDDPPEQVRARAEAELRYPEPAADAGEVERRLAKIEAVDNLARTIGEALDAQAGQFPTDLRTVARAVLAVRAALAQTGEPTG